MGNFHRRRQDGNSCDNRVPQYARWLLSLTRDQGMRAHSQQRAGQTHRERRGRPWKLLDGRHARRNPIRKTISLILLPLGFAALALTVSAPRALTATMQLSVSEGASTQNEGFYPQTQLPLTCKLKDGTVLKSLVKSDHLELVIERPGLRPVSVRLPDEFAQLNRIVPVPRNEAVLIGMASGEVYEVVIVDTVNCRIVDHFWCYEPDVSPNGRLIAFIKYYPPHFVPDVTDIVMIYDVTRRAAGNRPSSPDMVPDVDVGMRAYPPGTNTPDDNVGTGVRDVMLNSVTSERFFWTSDSSKFLFANEHVVEAHQATEPNKNEQSRVRVSNKVELSLVLVSIELSSEKPKITVFPVRECQSTCHQQLSSVEFAEDGIKAQFPGFRPYGKNESLEVKYADFRAP
jgi:hypothetical protein